MILPQRPQRTQRKLKIPLLHFTLSVWLFLAAFFESRIAFFAPQQARAAVNTLMPLPAPLVTPSATAMDDPLQPRPPAWPSATLKRAPSPAAIMSATNVDKWMRADAALQAAICMTDTQINLQEGQIVVPILLYHFVGRATLERKDVSTSRYNVTAADFEAHLVLLRQLGYHTVTVGEIAAALLDGQTLPERPVAITFDDGWSEQYSIAFPLLQKYGMKATFYVPSSYPVGKRFMTWEQLVELRDAGMEIGSHTRKHVNLLDVTDKVADAEITTSKATLEKKLDITIQSLAYPYGLYSKRVVALAQQAGYRAAAGLGGTLLHSQTNLYALPRIEIRGTATLADFVAHLPWRGQGTSLCPAIQPTAPSPDLQTDASSALPTPIPQPITCTSSITRYSLPITDY